MMHGQTKIKFTTKCIIIIITVLHISTVTCSNHYEVFIRPLKYIKTKITNAAPVTGGQFGISILGVILVVMYFNGLRKTTWLIKQLEAHTYNRHMIWYNDTIFIYCNWVSTRWQWSVGKRQLYTQTEKQYRKQYRKQRLHKTRKQA